MDQFKSSTSPISYVTRVNAWRRRASWTVCFALLYTLAGNVVFFGLSFMDLKIFHSPAVQLATKYGSRLTVASYSLFGFPLALAGVWGISYKAEKQMWWYFFYMLADVFVNAAYTTDAIFHFIPCATGKVHPAVQHPDIFQCGHPRGTMLLFLAFYVGFQVCLLYPVGTWCQELEYSSNSLDTDPEEYKKNRKLSRHTAVAEQWAGLRKGPLDHIHGRLRGEYGSACDTLKLMGAGLAQKTNDDSVPFLPAGRLV